MAVNLVIQNDQGTITNANGYIPISDPNAELAVPGLAPTYATQPASPAPADVWTPFGFTQYHSDRGQLAATFDSANPHNLVSVVLASGGTFSADQIASAIIRATDYLDKRFQFIGWRRYSNQPTAWPRWDAVDINDRYLKGLPLAIKQATAEYALRALQVSALVADPARDATGQTVRQQTKAVGPLKTQTTFAGDFVMPRYPAADAILRQWGLIIQGGATIRG